MGLSDPFQTTYEGTRQSLGAYGQAAQQVAQSFAAKKEEENKRSRSMQLLQQFGILKPNEPTLKDYEAEATKLGVTQFKTLEKAPEEEKLNLAKQMFDVLKIPHPQPQGMTFDYDAARKAGAQINLSTGETVLSPKKEDKTFGETLAEAQVATQAGMEYKAGKAQTKGAGGFGAAQIAFAEKEAPAIAEAMKRGDVAGYLKSTRQTQTAVAAQLSKEGVSVDDLVLGYGGEQAAIGNAKIQDQKVNAAISAKTLLDASFDEKTGEWRVPPSMHVELALSVARLLSATGQIPYEMVQELRQKTAREQFANMAIYLGADPRQIGGSTQDVIKLFSKTIEREAMASQAMRDRYFKGTVSKFEDTGKNLTDTAGLTSRIMTGTHKGKPVISNDGGKTWEYKK